MEKIQELFASFGMNFELFWKSALFLLLGSLLLSVSSRFVFGKRSTLNNAVSSAISILFIYAITIILRSAGVRFSHLVTPLPFIELSGDTMILFTFADAHYTAICTEILNMVILAFLVNLAESWIPRGKNVFTWLLLRCVTVCIGYLIHWVVVGLLARFLPTAVATYAPTILLVLLILLLLTGVLKILVGALISTVNPIIGGLYTFFFANVIGKQLTKAVLTTAILTALVLGLRYIGVSVISIAAAALSAYIPFVLILIVLWYIVCHVF